MGSLPSRERGLKSFWVYALSRFWSVAPLAGAWIEIQSKSSGMKLVSVAPLAGAWIEMYIGTADFTDYTVAPLAGAWIEISENPLRDLLCSSLPSRERGLK